VLTILYFIVEVFPWWAIPLALILVELAFHFRRTARTGKAVLCILTAFTLVVLTGVFIWENGVQNVRPAMNKIERTYLP
jgi:type II secretory pathway component PulM